ncbi:SIR2-like domain-containing protein [Xylaria curta]|nr:SIR2-like domain-containing protein [Xylaria curta]
MANDSLQDPATGSSPDSVTPIDANTSPDTSQPATLLDPTVAAIRTSQLHQPQSSGAVSPNSNPPNSNITNPPSTPIQGSSQPVPTQDQLDSLQLKAARRRAKKETKERESEQKKLEAERKQEEAVKKLGEQLKLGRLAICVGPGVTLYSASSQAQRLSWRGLVNSALDYYENQAQQPINQADLTSTKKILRKSNPTEAECEEVSNKIHKLLANRIDIKRNWMGAQFQNLYKDYVDQLDILDALKTLHQNGALLFTTNYDDLLEKHCGLGSIDAADPIGLVSWRQGSHQAVFHPYGSWRNANHIVLSAEQYLRLKNNQVVQETLQHVLASKTILFIGYGGNLLDPNFGPLIKWMGEKNAGTGASHYILSQPPEMNPITQLPLVHLQCEDFDAIPPFLIDLIPRSGRREGTLPELPNDCERKRIHAWLSPLDQTQFLNDMINLQGPNRFDRQVTQSRDVWSMNSPSRVLVTGEEGWGKTMFCASVIQNTLRDCHLGTIRHARDSLGYFFCATYQPYDKYTKVQINDFNMFLRTVISQLTPPDVVFEPLRSLYKECTIYHPARLPTNVELQEVLIQILGILDKPGTLKNGAPQVPGETYLVIDELNALTPTMQSQYSRFIKLLATQKLQHFHLLIATDNLVTVGVPPSPPPKDKGNKGKGKEASVLQTSGLKTADWYTVTLDWITTETAMLEWIRDCFANNPYLAVFSKLRSDIVYDIHKYQENFRWVYWKLDRLGILGATAGKLDDEALETAANDILDEDSKDEEVEEEDDNDDEENEDEEEKEEEDGEGDESDDNNNASNEDDSGPSSQSDNDDDDFLPGEKRCRKQEGGSNKRAKT